MQAGRVTWFVAVYWVDFSVRALGLRPVRTRTGAAVGAGVGVLSGDRKRQRQEMKIYRAAYRDCMAGRIH